MGFYDDARAAYVKDVDVAMENVWALWNGVDVLAGRVSNAEGAAIALDPLLTTTETTRGSSSDLSAVTPTNGAGGANIALAAPVSTGGTATALRVNAFAAGTVIVRSWSSADAVSFTLVDEQSVAVAAGYGEYPINVSVPAGGYIGACGGGIIGTGAGVAVSHYAGGSSAVASFTDSNGASNNSFALQITVETKTLRSDIGGQAPAPHAIHMSGGMGQSNMEGAVAGISTRQRYGAMGFNNRAAALEPLVAPGVGANEYPGFGFAQAFRELLMFAGGPTPIASKDVVIAGRSAKGATEIAALGKGSLEYDSAIDQIETAVSYAQSNNAALKYHGAAWVQGERDVVLGTTKAAYRAALVQLATDHDADARAALGEFGVSGVYPLFVAQITSGANYGDGTSEWAIPAAQLEASDLTGLVQVIGPMYHLPFADDRHVTAAGSRLLGAYFARAQLHWFLTKTAFSPLRAVEWWLNGNTIVISYSRAGLQFATSSVVAQQVNQGFRVYDGSNAPISITSITVTDNLVRITPASTPATGWRWTYGEGEAVGMSPYLGGAGNLRDASTETFGEQALHNWAVLQGGTI